MTGPARRWPSFSPAPLALVAATLALGDGAGLAVARSAATHTGLLVAVAGCACLLAGRVGVGAAGSAIAPRPAGGLPLGLALVFVALAGLAMGARSGARSLGACTAGLAVSAPVVAAGTLLDAVPSRQRRPLDARADGAPRPSLTRVRLGGVTLVSGGRRCRIPSLRAFVRPRDARLAAGTTVLARGAWRSMSKGGFPRPPEAHGWLSGAELEPVEATEEPARSPRLARTRAAWRGRLIERLDARLSARNAAIGRALLLADRSTLDPELRDTFVRAGIVHLLAISGLHVGFLGVTLAWLIGLRVRGPRRLIHAAVLVGGYVALIGAPPSAVRAALVFWGYALAARRQRPARVSDIGGLAAILALLAEPLILTDPGFQLSFAGFTGVILGGRVPLPPALAAGAVGGLGRGLAVSAGAFTATAPIAAAHFDRLVPAAIPASVVSGPVVGLALPALALTLILPAPLWGLFGGAADALLALLARIASLFAALPLGVAGPGLGPRAWLVFAALAALAFDRIGARRGLGLLAMSAALTIMWAGPAVRAVAGRGVALVCALDVGQGDAAAVRTGAGRWLLFDAGPGSGFGTPGAGSWAERQSGGDAGRLVVSPFLRAMGARTVEVFALSHPHLDHFGGSADIFDDFRVRRVLDPGVPEPSATYLAFLERAREEGAVWIGARAGDRLRVDDVLLEILWPRDPADADANEGSLSFRLSVRGFRYLNSGDASSPVERAILDATGASELEADVLKLGHHGSRTSTSLAWLRATRPDIAVISAGAGNRYGHPHAATLARLDSARVGRVWRTDVDGTLCVEVDDDGWRIVPPRAGRMGGRHAS